MCQHWKGGSARPPATTEPAPARGREDGGCGCRAPGHRIESQKGTLSVGRSSARAASVAVARVANELSWKPFQLDLELARLAPVLLAVVGTPFGGALETREPHVERLGITERASRDHRGTMDPATGSDKRGHRDYKPRSSSTR